jgi:CRISPR-associated endonuclease/helicase Cas3
MMLGLAFRHGEAARPRRAMISRGNGPATLVESAGGGRHMFFAHSTTGKDRSDWQMLPDHLVAVAALAAERGEKFGAQRAAALAGILHDLGKYTAAFQRRLDGSGEAVDHSTAGAKHVGPLVVGGADRGMAELIAYAIAGHHAGLPDREGEISSLAERLDKPIEPLDPAWLQELSAEPTDLMPNFRWEERDRSRLAFQLGFLGRMIFSCLVDADGWALAGMMIGLLWYL